MGHTVTRYLTFLRFYFSWRISPFSGFLVLELFLRYQSSWWMGEGVKYYMRMERLEGRSHSQRHGFKERFLKQDFTVLSITCIYEGGPLLGGIWDILLTYLVIFWMAFLPRPEFTTAGIAQVTFSLFHSEDTQEIRFVWRWFKECFSTLGLRAANTAAQLTTIFCSFQWHKHQQYCYQNYVYSHDS